MKKTAILLHSTFTRFEHLKKTVESFLNKDEFKLYISYTGELDLEILNYFEILKFKKGHEAYYMGWDTSPAITRNFLIDRIKEDYVFKVDDDFVYDEKTVKVKEIQNYLDNRQEYGLVGMSVYSKKYVSPFIYNVQFDEYTHVKDVILKKVDMSDYNPKIHTYKKPFVFHCDVTPDCWIAKREIFPECNYDERYHVCQGLHTDFFMHIKFNTNWKVAYTPDSKVYTFKHDPEWELSDEERKKSFYNMKRFRSLHTPKKGKEIFLKKWGAEYINKW